MSSSALLCQQCSTPIPARLGRFRRVRRRYCSRLCQVRAKHRRRRQRMHPTVTLLLTCAACSTPFVHAGRSNPRTRRFCSVACQRRALTITNRLRRQARPVPCIACRRPIPQGPERIAPRLCSLSCALEVERRRRGLPRPTVPDLTHPSYDALARYTARLAQLHPSTPALTGRERAERIRALRRHLGAVVDPLLGVELRTSEAGGVSAGELAELHRSLTALRAAAIRLARDGGRLLLGCPVGPPAVSRDMARLRSTAQLLEDLWRTWAIADEALRRAQVAAAGYGAEEWPRLLGGLRHAKAVGCLASQLAVRIAALQAVPEPVPADALGIAA